MANATSWQEMYKITLGHLIMLESMNMIQDHCGYVRRTQDTTLKGLLQAKDGYLCIKRIMTPMD